ncbi:MAG: DUF1573 domain-containing protein [Armatimonadota bacterium]
MIYKRVQASTLFVCLILFLLAHTSFATCKSCTESKLLCGSNCMIDVCHKMGIDSNLEEMKTLCGYDEKSGTTLLGLMNASKAKGLQAIGMKIGLDELATFRGPAIAHLWDNHFVVVEPGEADTIKVIDPPAEPQSMKKEDFKKAYSGFALLVAKDASAFPAPKPEGPDLRFDGYAWDFGSVMQGDQNEYSFKCRNVGNADLVISIVDTSCGECVVPIDGPQTIKPGGEGEIKALLLTANQKHGVAKKLYVTSNDPISPVVHLDVIGYVRPDQLLMSLRTVNFENPRRTETISREVYISSTPEDGVEVTSVKSDSPYITAALASSVDKNRPGYFITATLKPGAPIGELKGKLTIISNHPKQPKAELPITATIRGDIDLDRDMFFLGLAKHGQERKTSITISTVGNDPLKIGKIDCPLSYVSVDISPKTDGKEYLLTATLKPDAPIGNIKGDVTIHTNNPDQPTIKVPVFGFVES